MSLSEEQLRALESCPGLKALKPWFIAMDEIAGPKDDTETTVPEEDPEETPVEDPANG